MGRINRMIAGLADSLGGAANRPKTSLPDRRLNPPTCKCGRWATHNHIGHPCCGNCCGIRVTG